MKIILYLKLRTTSISVFITRKLNCDQKLLFLITVPPMFNNLNIFQNPRGIETTCFLWTKTSNISQKYRFKSHNLLYSYKQNKFDRCNTYLALKGKFNFKMQDFLLLEFKIHVKKHLCLLGNVCINLISTHSAPLPSRRTINTCLFGNVLQKS